MDSRGYFTGLMENGLGLSGEFENPPPSQEVVAQDEVEAIGKANMKRTKKNFTIEEDEQLVKSWLNVKMRTQVKSRQQYINHPHCLKMRTQVFHSVQMYRTHLQNPSLTQLVDGCNQGPVQAPTATLLWRRSATTIRLLRVLPLAAVPCGRRVLCLASRSSFK